MKEETMVTVSLTLMEFSIIIEALDKRHEQFQEDSDQAVRLMNLINNLDSQGLEAVGFK